MYEHDMGGLPPIWPERYPAMSLFPAYPGFIVKATDWGANKEWVGVGRLFVDGYISNGRVFYCPSKHNFFKDDGSFRYEGYSSNGACGWEGGIKNAAWPIYSNLWQRWNTWTNGREAANASVAKMQPSLSRNSPNRWLMTDHWNYYSNVLQQILDAASERLEHRLHRRTLLIRPHQLLMHTWSQSVFEQRPKLPYPGAHWAVSRQHAVRTETSTFQAALAAFLPPLLQFDNLLG